MLWKIQKSYLIKHKNPNNQIPKTEDLVKLSTNFSTKKEEF